MYTYSQLGDIHNRTTGCCIINQVRSTIIRLRDNDIAALANLKFIISVVTNFQLGNNACNFIDLKLIQYTGHAAIKYFNPVKWAVSSIDNFRFRATTQNLYSQD